MRAVRDSVVTAAMGLVGIFFGVLSALALALAAAIPPILGLIAVLLSPLRALVERLRRPRAAG